MSTLNCVSAVTERWVILGGTFDPVHQGHVQVARAAVDRLDAALGVLAVGVAHPHRPPVVLAWHDRVDLVRAAVADEPTLVEAGEVGAHRCDIVEVGRMLCSPGRELHFVFGSDSAARLVRWSGGAEVMALGTVWAIERSANRTALPAGIGRLVVPTLNASSTEVRARCSAGATIDHLVPESVKDRVVALYGASHPEPLALPA
jgi:nicotinate-nucleotide adenylyltransferase